MIKEPRWGSLRATLFGKFYEAIVAHYFAEELNFEVFDRDIVIDIGFLKGINYNNQNLVRKLENAVEQGIINNGLKDRLLDKFKVALNGLNRRRRFNPDLVVKKGDKYYVVEMQVWPAWLKHRYGVPKFSWKVILNEGVAIIPRVLADKVKVHGKTYDLSGFYYVTLGRSNDHNSIENFFKDLTGREFKLWYVDEVICQCYEREWFRDIISAVKHHVDDSLAGLNHGEIRICLRVSKGNLVGWF